MGIKYLLTYFAGSGRVGSGPRKVTRGQLCADTIIPVESRIRRPVGAGNAYTPARAGNTYTPANKAASAQHGGTRKWDRKLFRPTGHRIEELLYTSTNHETNYEKMSVRPVQSVNKQ